MILKLNEEKKLHALHRPIKLQQLSMREIKFLTGKEHRKH